LEREERRDREGGAVRESTRASQSWNGRTLKMIPTRSVDCNKKIADIVARRAFQICEASGFTPGHETIDWQRAESEIVSPICGGWTVSDGTIVVTATAASYKEGEIEICVEPRRLVILGKQQAFSRRNALAQSRYNTQEKETVRILELPVEVDPAGATARFNHCMVEISLPKLQCARAAGAGSGAA